MISGFWWVTAGRPSPCPFNTATSYHRWGRRWRRRGNQAQNEQRHDAGQHWGNICHLHQVWSLTQFFHFWTAASSLHLRKKQIKHSALLFLDFRRKEGEPLLLPWFGELAAKRWVIWVTISDLFQTPGAALYRYTAQRAPTANGNHRRLLDRQDQVNSAGRVLQQR